MSPEEGQAELTKIILDLAEETIRKREKSTITFQKKNPIP